MRIGGAQRLERREVLKRIALLQKLRLNWDGVELQLADAAHFQELKPPRYTYLDAQDRVIDNRTGTGYTPLNGYFTDANGERLLPGYRIHVGGLPITCGC